MFKRHRNVVQNFSMRGEQYKKEVKRQIRLLIIVTLGFTVAFSWRQTVFDIFQTAIQKMFPIDSAAWSSALTSLFITLISLILIFIVSYFLQDKNNSY